MVESESAGLTSQEPTDYALLAAWRRFLDYDRVSTQQKQLHQRLRGWVIVLSLLTSTFAVLSTYVIGVNWLSEPIRVILVILPIVSVGVMNYATQFASSTTWIEYRVGAETIRSQIYLYRLRAGTYRDKPRFQSQQHLLGIIHSADKRIEAQNATLPYQQRIDTNLRELIAEKTDSPGKDLGLRPLTVPEYIEWRMKPQINWYVDKIDNDYNNMRRERVLALIVAGTGSVIAAAGSDLVALAAITTAMGVALTTRSTMRMYGATYGIFHMTANNLRNALVSWQIMPAEKQRSEREQKQFVERIERIFASEREMWRTQAVQSQMDAEQAINQTVRATANAQIPMDADNIPLYAPNTTVGRDAEEAAATLPDNEVTTFTAVAPDEALPLDDDPDDMPMPLPFEDPAVDDNGSADRSSIRRMPGTGTQ